MGRTLVLALPLALLVSGAAAEIRIGVSAPLTGPDAAFGQGVRIGAEQAVADINRAGGVEGQRLALVVADDAGDGRQGTAVARRFATQGVGLVVGPLNTLVAAAALPAYEAAGIVAVTPGATWPPLTGQGRWNVFRTCANDAAQGMLAGAYLVERHRDRRIAIVHDRTAFGRGLAEAVSRALKAAGQRETAFEGMNRSETDLPALAAKLKRVGVEAVYFGGFAAEAAPFLRALRGAGVSAPLIASDGILDKEFSQSPFAEGTAMTLAPEPRRLPEQKGLGARAARAPEAEAFAAQAYAAVEVLAAAAARAGSSDGRAVAATLHAGTPVRTILGPLAFDAAGDLAPSPYLVQVWKRTPDGRLDHAGNPPSP